MAKPIVVDRPRGEFFIVMRAADTAITPMMKTIWTKCMGVLNRGAKYGSYFFSAANAIFAKFVASFCLVGE